MRRRSAAAGLTCKSKFETPKFVTNQKLPRSEQSSNADFVRIGALFYLYRYISERTNRSGEEQCISDVSNAGDVHNSTVEAETEATEAPVAAEAETEATEAPAETVEPTAAPTALPEDAVDVSPNFNG